VSKEERRKGENGNGEEEGEDQETIGDLGASDGLGMGEGMRRIAWREELFC
jgi:hypothetical protein